MDNKQQEDYYINENGLLVFTAAYHLKRGVCCGNACLHCPYNHENVIQPKTFNNTQSKDNASEGIDL
ncbi:MAG: hypothetical protein KGN97_05330 [Bacteroidota bacterium]|jgi:hypothetical protein|nr:hypothetical protein [Bacteroidota bacterium]